MEGIYSEGICKCLGMSVCWWKEVIGYKLVNLGIKRGSGMEYRGGDLRDVRYVGIYFVVIVVRNRFKKISRSICC